MTRAAAFLALLVIAFVAAFGVGRVAPVDAAAPAEEEHTEGSTAEAASLPGLSIAASGFRLVAHPRYAPGRRRVEFAIVDRRGSFVRDFDVLHERRMHVILVRRDLTGFQHLHPTLSARGVWQVRTDLRPGVYRLFADFESRGTRSVLGADMFVGGGIPGAPLAPEPATRPAAGYRVELSADDLVAEEEERLAFVIRRNGRRVKPEPYLGARGHLVVLREGDLAYIHAHADEDAETADFETTLPNPGRYRAFLQFAHEGDVQTAEFALEAR